MTAHASRPCANPGTEQREEYRHGMQNPRRQPPRRRLPCTPRTRQRTAPVLCGAGGTGCPGRAAARACPFRRRRPGRPERAALRGWTSAPASRPATTACPSGQAQAKGQPGHPAKMMEPRDVVGAGCARDPGRRPTARACRPLRAGPDHGLAGRPGWPAAQDRPHPRSTWPGPSSPAPGWAAVPAGLVPGAPGLTRGGERSVDRRRRWSAAAGWAPGMAGSLACGHRREHREPIGRRYGG